MKNCKACVLSGPVYKPAMSGYRYCAQRGGYMLNLYFGHAEHCPDYRERRGATRTGPCYINMVTGMGR